MFDTGMLVGEKYRVTGCVGSGGMGIVYAATNEWTGREVVIKTMQADANLGRFMREVRATASVKHPNIVDVLDLVKVDGSLCLILERLTGQSLQEFLSERKRLAPTQLIDLLLPVLDALEFTHQKGLIHRDIKPSNIFLAQINDVIVPKLLDFGIASVRDAPALTVAGEIFGTPGYLAPEQLAGKPPSPATDLWAIGVLMFQCLSGELPFGNPSLKRLFAPLEAAGPELGLISQLPEPLVRVIAWCLKRRECDRPESAAQLAEALCALPGVESTASMSLKTSAARSPRDGALDDTVRASKAAAASAKPSSPASSAISVGAGAAGAAHSGLSLRWQEANAQRSFELPLAEVSLGTTDNGGLILGAPAGARMIAKLRPVGPTFSIAPLGSSELRRNGRVLTSEAVLQPGDTLGVESWSLTFERARRQ